MEVLRHVRYWSGSNESYFLYGDSAYSFGIGGYRRVCRPLFLALALSRKLLDVVWALLACVGILLIVPWKSDHIDLVGLGLAFLAGMFWAVYIVMGGKVSKIMDGKDAVTTGMLFASLVIIPFTIWDGAVFNLTPSIFVKGLG